MPVISPPGPMPVNVNGALGSCKEVANALYTAGDLALIFRKHDLTALDRGRHLEVLIRLALLIDKAIC